MTCQLPLTWRDLTQIAYYQNYQAIRYWDSKSLMHTQGSLAPFWQKTTCNVHCVTLTNNHGHYFNETLFYKLIQIYRFGLSCNVLFPEHVNLSFTVNNIIKVNLGERWKAPYYYMSIICRDLVYIREGIEKIN